MGFDDPLWPTPESSAPPAATGSDLESSLAAAEMLLAGAENAQRAALLVVSITCAASVVAIGLIAQEASASHWVGALVAALAVVGNGAAATATVLRLIKGRDLKRSLANTIVVMLREIAADVYEREQWSHVKRRAMMTRLSAFPIRPLEPSRRPPSEKG